MSTHNIVEEIKNELLNVNTEPIAVKYGEVVENSDGIVRIFGLADAGANEILEIECEGENIEALTLNLEEHSIGAVVLGDYTKIKAGQRVYASGRTASINASDKFIGRVVNALGKPIDGKGAISGTKQMPIEKIAPGVITRQSVSVPLQTGIKAIDALIPIGRGQRELIIGDRSTGKTAIAIDAIINQANIPSAQRPVCIYVAIGQKKSKVAKIAATLQEKGAMEYSIILVAGASDPAALSYLAPYAGCAIAEYFMEQGKDVLIVYDDLTKHAWAYRQISLLLRRPPGREAYPGDVFYLHSRLLERSARLSEEFGGGSITALPIIETQAGDVSAYIPTNVISITDGQIFLESSLFYQGIRPALNIGISVSRVGGSAQIKAMKKVAGKLKLEMAQYRELAAFAQFASDLDEKTRTQIERGKRITEVLKQKQYEPLTVGEQVIILYAVTNGYMDKVEVDKITETEEKLLTLAKSKLKQLLSDLQKEGDLNEKQEKELIHFLQTSI